MNDNSGLAFAFALDGRGSGRSLNLEGAKKWRPEDGTPWIHLDYTGNAAKDWLRDDSVIDPVMLEALTAEETRPWSLVHKGGMLIILRGVNLNPGTDPEDMVSIRYINSILDRVESHRDVAAPSCHGDRRPASGC